MAETKIPNVEKGNISVHTENIFPIIKKSLYSDHEIFLRELVSNAVDATRKLKYLDVAEDLDSLKVVVEIDKEKKTITVRDQGIGMTAEEVKKYINQLAFSGAEEFVKQFTEAKDANAIIGQFGLGFYSAFMVANQVEIFTKSHQKDEEGVHWTCEGSTSYTLESFEKSARGTDIVLHISEDSEEFLDEQRLKTILNKYCRFMPVIVEIKDEIISGKKAIWTQAPSALKDEDYLELYRTLYPFSEEPLFWIHLNVDFPFNLTGVLFFPKHRAEMETLRKDRLQLFSRGVFITDKVEDIVPEYLLLLQGVIESPDIPLNVSRSFLQADSSVKKINGYISKKVSDKLNELFKEDRKTFEEKWPYMEIFVRYGMISDEKFYDVAKDFSLIKSVAKVWYTLDEFETHITEKQTNKDNKKVILYTTDAKGQDNYISAVTKKGLEVLVMESILDNHLIETLERKRENQVWKRVDSDSPDKLIEKENSTTSPLEKEQETELKELFEKIRSNEQISVNCEPLGEEEMPVLITRPEFMRRMKDMASVGGMKAMGEMPEFINLIINTSHPLAKVILERKSKDSKEKLAKQLTDLALLSQGLLSGADLTEFIGRSISVLK